MSTTGRLSFPPRHPGDDVADPAPGVEASMQAPQLRLACLKRDKPKRGSQELDAGL